jgi:hypothetical protein
MIGAEGVVLRLGLLDGLEDQDLFDGFVEDETQCQEGVGAGMPEGYKHFSKTKPMKLEHFTPVAEWWNNRTEITEDGFDKAKQFTVKQLTEELNCYRKSWKMKKHLR